MLAVILAFAAVSARAAVLNVTDIQGSSFASPLLNQAVTVQGIVTAKGSQGFYIQSGSTDDVRVSSGLHVFSTSATVRNAVNVGDLVGSWTCPMSSCLTPVARRSRLTARFKSSARRPST